MNLKQIVICPLIMSVLLFNSCEQENFSRAGFNASFDENATGLTLLEVDRQLDILLIEGTIVLESGEIEVTLEDPEGVAVYNAIFSTPDTIDVNESVVALPGTWELSYESREGVGTIELHVCY